MVLMPLIPTPPTGPPDFQDPHTPVRLRPGTQLSFDGDTHVTLSHHKGGDKAVRIEYDILLILYAMVPWTTIAAVCDGWPPDDQAKIQQHIAMFYDSGLVITEPDAQTETPSLENATAQRTADVTINVENHHVMLRDVIRVESYRRAIERAVKPGSVVMDLGAGSGILSFFAAKAGASRVYAIEKRPDMVMLATELAKVNQLDGQVTFIQNSSHLIEPSQLDPKPTLLVSEILGNAILEEHVLEYTLDARDRLLAPGGKLLPAAVEIFVAPFDAGPAADRTQEVTELEGMYGLKFDMLKKVLAEKLTMKLDRFNPMAYTMMSDPVSVINLDFQTLKMPTFAQPFTITPFKDGHISGICAYFKAHLDEETILTNSPWAPQTHWTQVVFHFPTRKPVTANTPVAMKLAYDGGLSLWFQDDYPDA